MNLSVTKRFAYGGAAIFLFLVSLPVLAAAGAKIKIDDDKYFQIGVGVRGSVSVVEDGATNGTSNAFNPAPENIRLYTVSQVHKNVQVEYNTELAGESINLLDVIVKLDLGVFDLWVGRQLPPSDRANMDGPFYLNAAWSYPMVQSFGNQGCAGCNGARDNGMAFHGEVNGGKFKWAYGVFEGLAGGADQADNVRHAASLTYAFDDAEPGFYSGSTYFGSKKITTLNLAMHHEEDGVGTATDQGNFTGYSADVLIERTLGNGAVVDLEGAYYDWDTDDKSDGTIVQGNSFFVLASYLMPGKASIGGIEGQFQPYTRYQGYNRDLQNTATNGIGYKDSIEAGVNYVIDAFNAKVTALWQQTEDVTSVNKYVLGMQFQL
ncbi:MAG: hypothetical protein QGH98_00225 [Nitrospinaceae bacterium]|nr:hypothetical protein [Nitrospinaceae bacterium]